MLKIILTLGTVAGLVLGTVHAIGVFRTRRRTGGAATPQAAYAAIWTFVLWTLAGSYVLVLWLVSLPLWAGRRVLAGA